MSILKNIKFGILFGFILTAVVNSFASPTLWKIQSQTSDIYLFGSIHVGNSSMYPLAPKINQAYSQSDNLVVEVDILSPESLKSIGWLWLNGTMKDHQTLKNVLDTETFKLLQKTLEIYKVPYSSMQNLKPWIVALNLSNLNMTAENLSPQLGIDFHFLRRAHAEHKNILQFETASEQLGYFDTLPIDQQSQFLKGTLEQMISDEAIITNLLKFWKSGNQLELRNRLLNGTFQF